MANEREGWPFGDKLTCRPTYGAEATKNRGCDSMKSAWSGSMEGKNFTIVPVELIDECHQGNELNLNFEGN